ncbi:MAG: hypothetical protein QGG19_14915 [Alphaproteobacteria bacterium]|nr:hypothetical protein [Alphaproteobacteria bacterium]MDP6255068.1 hypothetical protein [Alphaproteobacteria bacterium]MDP7230242.1 hypothetical protein [Alphaproteobacteria bacterium]MDP7460306.1 hypothetical protein [Alphaproteobacteria bacterium]MEE1554603.1 hypothetical protein [Alphaproteobacteria bacterium]
MANGGADKLEALRVDIKTGVDQAERGELRTVTAEDIMQRVRKRLEDENSTNPTA